MTSSPGDRRRFPRLQADVYVRPLGAIERLRFRRVNDVSLGGVRAYSDDEHRPGERLEIEVLCQPGASIVVAAEVVWVDPLPPDGPARFDVGFRFIDAEPEALERLSRLLAKEPA